MKDIHQRRNDRKERVIKEYERRMARRITMIDPPKERLDMERARDFFYGCCFATFLIGMAKAFI